MTEITLVNQGQPTMQIIHEGMTYNVTVPAGVSKNQTFTAKVPRRLHSGGGGGGQKAGASAAWCNSHSVTAVGGYFDAPNVRKFFKHFTRAVAHAGKCRMLIFERFGVRVGGGSTIRWWVKWELYNTVAMGIGIPPLLKEVVGVWYVRAPVPGVRIPLAAVAPSL